jgi:TonB family protein
MSALKGRLLSRIMRCGAFAVAVVCALSSQVRAKSDLERSLNAEYKAKILRLRNPAAGDRLVFGSDGTLLQGGGPGTWALDGNIAVIKFMVDQDQVEIEGRRVYLDWDSDKGQFQPLPARAVHITVTFPSAGLSSADAEQALALIFSVGTDADAVPSYWKFVMEHPFSKGKSSKEATEAAQIGTFGGQPVYSFGSKGEVTLPVPIRQPNPPYTPEARRAKVSGTVVLFIIVDAQGDVPDVIEGGKPLGFGLDQLAILTVQEWKFKPARKGGAPIAVQFAVEVSFRLLG